MIDFSPSATERLRAIGQSIWVDNITRDMLSSGALARYIRMFSVTGLTSNPTIFDQAIKNSDAYDEEILSGHAQGLPGEAVFFNLAIRDLTRAAALFRRIHRETGGADGWVSLEVSPLLGNDTAATVMAAVHLHALAGLPNLMIKIPGTQAGLAAIEAAIFSGIPVNVTLLFSREQYLAAAGAYMRGIERRLEAGLDARVMSVASLFVSRWDAAIHERVQGEFRNRLGIAVAMRTYKAYRDLLASPRWLRLAEAGARVQRLLWASTGSKDPQAPDTLYVDALGASGTINTVPEKTLLAFSAHGRAGDALPADGGYAETVLAEFAREGVDIDLLATNLQRDGVEVFASSWRDLIHRIGARSAAAARHR